MARVGRKEVDAEKPEEGFIHDDPAVDEALNWFVCLRGTAPDPATLAAFGAWLERNPRHAAEFRSLEAIWGSAPFKTAAESLPTARPMSALDRSSRSATAPRSRRRAMRTAIAASIAALAIGTWHFPTLLLHWQADYITVAGAQSTVTLPDGSIMMLNTQSAVAIDFKDDRRNVRLLEGEAFFDVRRDPSHPFHVVARFGEVEVKGTAFAVHVVSEQDRVILERGQVDVRRFPNLSDRVKLEPGQMAVATSAAMSIASVDPANALAWREGRIVFDNEPFAKVLGELRRYYRGSVIVVSGRIDDLPVTGNYRIDDIEGAIRTLADVAGATMTRLPGGIIILR